MTLIWVGVFGSKGIFFAEIWAKELQFLRNFEIKSYNSGKKWAFGVAAIEKKINFWLKINNFRLK